MQLSRHYTLGDFAQPPCRGYAAVRYPLHFLQRLRTLVTLLELLNQRLETPVRVLSGFRSAPANLRANGEKQSAHLGGWAADIHAPGTAPEDLFAELYQMHLSGTRIGGLGLFPAYVHVDVREGEDDLALVGPEDGLASHFSGHRQTVCLVCHRPVQVCLEMGGTCRR